MWRDGTALDPLSDTFRSGEPTNSGLCAYWDMSQNGLSDIPCESWPRIICEKDVTGSGNNYMYYVK